MEHLMPSGLERLTPVHWYQRSKLPRHDLGQRRWLLICAGSFAAAGVWRATTHLFETPAATAAAKSSPTTRLDTQP
ncbi:hypothetical protein, variant 2 [Phytophthora nicotianae P10297]|uniref:Uncharacterized protein n=1 Tax=Phytophthora nicotianae P10297 TaxID=1317064 RepID=W2ZYG9_PHYNI|nr:hypothetical protein, variant 2 [Phytophthora nicotianae P10297]